VVLWRRVPPDKITFDHNQNRVRPSSNAFTDNLKEGSPMSAWEASVVTDPNKLLEGCPGWFVAAFTVGHASALGLQVNQTSEHGPGHCDVVGSKSASIRSSLAKAAMWVIAPPS
jgi:hypothetical protein